MTEQPPAPEKPSGGDLPDLSDDDYLDISDSFSTPDVHAVIGFVLSCVSLLGTGVLNGSVYLYQSLPANDSLRSHNVLAALLGAALALIGVTLGWRASARVIEGDPAWIATLARAAVVLGLMSAFLRLVIAVIAAGSDVPTQTGNY
jgi:hypothetical protein